MSGNAGGVLLDGIEERIAALEGIEPSVTAFVDELEAELEKFKEIGSVEEAKVRAAGLGTRLEDLKGKLTALITANDPGSGEGGEGGSGEGGEGSGEGEGGEQPTV